MGWAVDAVTPTTIGNAAGRFDRVFEVKFHTDGGSHGSVMIPADEYTAAAAEAEVAKLAGELEATERLRGGH